MDGFTATFLWEAGVIAAVVVVAVIVHLLTREDDEPIP